MPNWCENELRITGPLADRQAFVNKAGEEFQLGTFYPMPKELEDVHDGSTTIDGIMVHHWREIDGKQIPVDVAELQRKHGAKSWYDWSVEHWGTKWDLSEVRVLVNGRGVLYSFNTAWAPPCSGILEISKQYPNLKFKLSYWEGGMAFQGVFIVQNGEVLSDVSGKYFGHRGG